MYASKPDPVFLLFFFDFVRQFAESLHDAPVLAQNGPKNACFGGKNVIE